MRTRLSRAPHCVCCGRPRPADPWVLGVDAVVGDRVVAWLCDACAEREGQGEAFVAALRRVFPEADLLGTTISAAGAVRAPLGVTSDQGDAAGGRG